MEETNIGNGDPIIVYIDTDEGSRPISLGTGFESQSQLMEVIEHAATTGGRGNGKIPPDKAELIHEASYVHIFTLTGSISRQ